MAMESITSDFPRLDPLKEPNRKAVFHEGFCASLKHTPIRKQGRGTLQSLGPRDHYERGDLGRRVPSAAFGSPENPRNCLSFWPLHADVCCISIACCHLWQHNPIMSQTQLWKPPGYCFSRQKLTVDKRCRRLQELLSRYVCKIKFLMLF